NLSSDRAVERTREIGGHAARGKTPLQNCTRFMVRVQFCSKQRASDEAKKQGLARRPQTP
ncbi:MAG TPA: hypothetical protein VET87_14470, partial [Rubrivivax sp.]|nr:hypothetical protein [Rubrivivax sp.]